MFKLKKFFSFSVFSNSILALALALILITLSANNVSSIECYESSIPTVYICFEEKETSYNTTFPTIYVNFSQQSGLTLGNDYALLNYNSSEYEGIIKTGSNSFKPLSHLPPKAKYVFSVTATNPFGLRFLVSANFTIRAPTNVLFVEYPKNKHISKPDFAYGNTTTYLINLTLQRPATCRYSTYQAISGNEEYSDLYDQWASNSFSSSPDKKNAFIQNFNPGNAFSGYPYDGSEDPLYKMYIICKEVSAAEYSFDVIYVGSDMDATSLDVSADPSPIIDGNFPNSTIRMSTDDLSVCTITNMDPGSGAQYKYVSDFDFTTLSEFHRNNNDSILITDSTFANRDFKLNVVCDNLANFRSSYILTLPVRMQFDQEVTVLSPSRYTNEDLVKINVKTKLTDICSYRANSSDIWNTLTTSDNGRNHTATRSLVEGDYELSVKCGQTAVVTKKEFTVDKTPPLTPNITSVNSTCSLTALNAEIDGDDNSNGSGLDKFYYNATIQNYQNHNYDFDGFTTKKIQKSIQGSAIKGKIYQLSVNGIDNAGNMGLPAIKYIAVTDANAPECDFIKPNIVIKANYSNNTKEWNIKVNCTDSQSGCRTTFSYGILNANNNSCLYSMTKNLMDPIIITSSSKVCFSVYDNNLNNKTENEVYIVGFPLHCSDNLTNSGESGVDCGGSCPDCLLNQSCRANDDCASGYCNSNRCSVASCIDNKKNGLETGVDCGGVICGACAINATCVQDIDCSSNNCASNKCAVASCTDLKKDGLETDVDCGGGTCSPCANTFKCVSNLDCTSGICDYNRLCSSDAGDGNGGEDCVGDECENIEPDDGGMSLPKILLMVGIFAVLAGIGLYVYDKFKGPVKQESSAGSEAVAKQFAESMSETPRPVIIKPVRELSPQEIKTKQKLREKAVRARQQQRTKIISEFNDENKTHDEKKEKNDIIEKNDKTIKEQKTSSQNKEDKSEDEDVFEKLKKISKKQK